MTERLCKCGRARIIKIAFPGGGDRFLPLLDGEALPVYVRLGEAKEAIEEVAAQKSAPKPTQPSAASEPTYRNVGAQEGAASYEATKAWFAARRAGRQETDAYTVLGLEASASAEEIRRAFRRLQLEFHPDRNPNDEEAATRFRQVVEAGQRLLDTV